MARQPKQNEDDIPTTGRCVICATAGMAFTYCEDCGEDSGAICEPDSILQDNGNSYTTLSDKNTETTTL